MGMSTSPLKWNGANGENRPHPAPAGGQQPSIQAGSNSFFCNPALAEFISISDIMKNRSLAHLLILLIFALPLLAFQQGKSTEVPKKPYDLEAKTRFDGAVAVAQLNWRDQSDNELGFEVLRSDNGEKFHVVGMVGANTTHYDDKVGKYVTGAFSYKVRAFNQAGRSEDSNVVSVWF